MSLEENKTLVRRFFEEVFNRGNTAVIRDGRIYTMSSGTDRMAILEQLGVAQMPGQPAA